jgi:serine/threonine protein kinase/tetratricopeptide (TPR) repeat protein
VTLADPERWTRAKELFQSALEYAPADRERFLADACGGDDELRRGVLSLLHSDEKAGAFLEEAPDENALEDDEADALVGRRIGPYRLTAVIGGGGMGTVYRAVRSDSTYEKEVAVKLVKRGLETDAVLRRFRAERQILARLDHPGIARLLDGGTTTDGRPYFVLELIDGRPIDEWVAARGLDIRGRLELFLKVCAAVQYAHQNLFVHRDLKPANVLVTPQGEPKLLDFGIAKVLDPEWDGEATAAVQRPMTPEYASPEQVRGEPITTATDVHALGLMLYEILTGHHAYRAESRDPAAIAHKICYEEPARPSTAAGRDRHSKALTGDLDTIVLKALRKEPARRYGSAEQLADDIRRHLDGLPVRARKDTLPYRIGKFLRRNRIPVAAAAAVVAAVTWGFVSTRAERARAERGFQDTRRLANALIFDIHDAIQPLAGSTEARQMLVKEALTYLDRLSAEVKGDLELQQELAQAYSRLGDVQGGPGAPHLGDTAGALQSYRKAIAFYRAVTAVRPRDAHAQLQLGVCYNKAARALEHSGDVATTVADFEVAHQAAEAALALAPDDPASTVLLIDIETSQIGVLRRHRGMAGAMQSSRAALDRASDAARRWPQNGEVRRCLGNAYQEFASCLRHSGDLPGALEYQRKALAVREALLADEPRTPAGGWNVAGTHFYIARVLMEMARREEAAAELRKVEAMGEGLAQADPKDMEVQRGLLLAETELCALLPSTSSARDTLPTCRRLVARAEAFALAAAGSIEGPLMRGDAELQLGEALRRSGDRAGAAGLFERARARFAAVRHEHADYVPARRGLADAEFLLAGVLSEQGQTTGALGHYQSALELLEPLAAADHARELHGELASAHRRCGDIHARLAAGGPVDSHWRDARAEYQRALELLSALRRPHPLTAEQERDRAAAERGLARCPITPS